MTNQNMRGSAPGRAREAYQRPGSFKLGRTKRGGRRRGTPNAYTADYKKAVLEAAHRIGYDGNGKDGVAGYLMWVAVRYPRAFALLLDAVLSLEALETAMTVEPLPTVEQINERVRGCIDNESEIPGKPVTQNHAAASVDWTGQDFPLSSLMHLAVESPHAFSKLMAAAFLRTPGKRRRLMRPLW